MPLITNFHTSAFAANRHDDRTIEQMAWHMGVNAKVLKKQIAAKRELSLKAWRKRKNPEQREPSQAFHRYEEVFSHAGKQVFHNDWYDVYAVFGLPGGMRDVKTLDEAIRLVYEA